MLSGEAQISELLVDVNLVGHDSHDVIRIPQYIKRLKDGNIKPEHRWRLSVRRCRWTAIWITVKNQILYQESASIEIP